jgi:hypothetical protein
MGVPGIPLLMIHSICRSLAAARNSRAASVGKPRPPRAPSPWHPAQYSAKSARPCSTS